MKKYFIPLIVFIILSYSNIKAKSTNVIGGGVGYGFEIETQAIQFGAVIEIIDQIMFAPDFKYFLVPEIEGTLDKSWWEINANAHYYLTDGRITKLYILSGLQYAHTEVITKIDNQSASEGNVGINIGGGINFDLGRYNIIPELKYVVAGNQQLFLGVSAYFNI